MYEFVVYRLEAGEVVIPPLHLYPLQSERVQQRLYLLNSDGEVNGVAVTNSGTGFTGTPTVGFTGGSGSGATATASMLAYIDFGTTISEIFRVTENDPYGTNSANDIAYRNIYAAGASDYGKQYL